MGHAIRRALISVSDKTGIEALGRALHAAGAELVATGRTATVLEAAGLPVVPIERLTGNPEAFQGRMKTLSYPVCAGILARRGDPSDEADLARLKIAPIDCVVVNFYPFEAAAAKPGISREELTEEIDIGGPTLVRSAAKNAPATLVLTRPTQYAAVAAELSQAGQVSEALARRCASEAWEEVARYDEAIRRRFGTGAGAGSRALRYGENPHQSAVLDWDPEGPIAWEPLTPSELSYNNILDLSAAYALASDLAAIDPRSTGVVIVKHNNPCGVAMVPKTLAGAQQQALERAWEGDPVSAFGGVIVFTDPLEETVATWLSERFVEAVAAPGLTRESGALFRLTAKRRNLKAVEIRRLGEAPRESVVSVPGGILRQSTDVSLDEKLTPVTRARLPEGATRLARFGIAVCRSLKSNAIALVREVPGSEGICQLAGAGQGQPNRVDALERLAVPRARDVVKGDLQDCLLVSDAFFPFRDTVDAAHRAGLRSIVQPGGSIKDSDSIQACDEHGMAMAFTGVRHFRH